MAARILTFAVFLCSCALAWPQPRLNGAFDHDRGTLQSNLTNPGTGSVTFTNTTGASVTFANTIFVTRDTEIPAGTYVLLLKAGSYPLAYSWPASQRFVYGASSHTGAAVPIPVDSQGKFTSNVAFFGVVGPDAYIFTNPATIGSVEMPNGITLIFGLIPNSYSYAIPTTLGEGAEGSCDFSREIGLIGGRIRLQSSLRQSGIGALLRGGGRGAVSSLRLGVLKTMGAGNRYVECILGIGKSNPS